MTPKYGKLSIYDSEAMSPSIGLLANACEVSERTLRSIFHECVGMSPQDYIMLKRIHEARRRLLADPTDTGSTVREIATSMGFNDAGRFAGRYRDAFLELPSTTLHHARRFR